MNQNPYSPGAPQQQQWPMASPEFPGSNQQIAFSPQMSGGAEMGGLNPNAELDFADSSGVDYNNMISEASNDAHMTNNMEFARYFPVGNNYSQ